MQALERRVDALEAREGAPRVTVMVIQFVPLKREGAEPPRGITASLPHFPEPVDRLATETWDEFSTRLEGMVAHLPAGSVVRVFAQT